LYESPELPIKPRQIRLDKAELFCFLCEVSVFLGASVVKEGSSPQRQKDRFKSPVVWPRAMELNPWISVRRCLIAVLVQSLLALVWHGASISAQHLPIRHYNVSEGLAHSEVTSILQDRKGYLWFGTFEGLSRFDGYSFTNYTTRDGLDNLIVSAIAEDGQGRLWVGTLGGGIARLQDDANESVTQKHEQGTHAQKKFTSYKVDGPNNQVSKILFDTHGTLWCIVNEGLYRAPADAAGELKFERVAAYRAGSRNAAFSDSRRRLWFGIGGELIEIVEERVTKYEYGSGIFQDRATKPGEIKRGQQDITGIAEDREGRLFFANRRGLFEFIEPASGVGAQGLWKISPLPLLQDEQISSMIADPTGGLLIGTTRGLIRYKDGQQAMYRDEQGLSGGNVQVLAQDREGNLWIGTEANGVYKLSKEIIVSYTVAEGLPNPDVGQVFEDREGRIYALTGSDGLVEIVASRAVPVPGTQNPPFNTIKVLLDSRDDWWVWSGGRNNLFRFHGLKPQFKNGEEITPDQGNQVSHWGHVSAIYEDRTGTVWISGIQGRGSIYRFDPSSRESSGFERISIADELDRFVAEQARRRGQRPKDSEIYSVTRMTSDSSGALWFGTYGELGRFANGKLNIFEPADGLPETLVRALFVDSHGSLWVGLRYGGVSMTKDPTAEHPTFVNFSTRTGLASDSVQSVTEDNFGRIYIGTGRGLDQLDPATGSIRHFTTTDGLAGTWVRHCVKDSSGNIWIATMSGLSRLNPQVERANNPPPVYLSRIRIAGEDLPLPETGALRVPEISLPASSNNLLIEYVGISFQGENVLRYQYKLEGVDQDWNAPTELRTVNYVRLPAGAYRFLVRAINQQGETSAQPAIMQFHILPPIWQRWWFVLLVVMAIGMSGLLLHRFRVRQIVAVEKIRRQVATDLHDDVGSGLAQIAILSEVAKRQATSAAGGLLTEVAKRQATSAAGGLLTEVAELARSMRESMSEIVWAVDPRKDSLSDLVQRMRQTAFNLLEADGLPVQFHAPDDAELERVGLGPDKRRQLLLIFKETLTNVARHAQAQHIQVEIKLVGSDLHLRVQDDGRGFDLQNNASGHGLHSLRQRAGELRAQLEITSVPGKGTTVELTMPLK
jgi:ligand-binding sensor domain-containing protein/signal transduction histidine kinase